VAGVAVLPNAPLVAAGVPQTDLFWPRAEGPPNAPGVEVAPNAGAAGAAPKVEDPKDGLAGPPNAEVAGCRGAVVEFEGGLTPPAATSPEYIVPCRMESEYMNHQEASTPSLLRTMRAGKGVGDSLISSYVGIGLCTFSLLERSNARPIGEVSLSSAVIGRAARRESSVISVKVNTPVTLSACLSLVSGTLDLLKSPISLEAVEETTSKSCRFGGKSRNRSKK